MQCASTLIGYPALDWALVLLLTIFIDSYSVFYPRYPNAVASGLMFGFLIRSLIENNVNLSIYVRDASSGIAFVFLLMRLTIIFISHRRLPANGLRSITPCLRWTGCAAAKGLAVRG
ncbi:hypothetical protein BC1002_6289 [Paraburkholderia atlantica]|uniref:Uncharacterized protein n=1 Tax=Paraburkholderia atlantica TaxID=2654982 RepID=D5WLQ0_PARAM|nr:hypothetical protein [Paraburkholderia atlantica]ADG20146.1 hypothetical protein BC1002_6289 [Paraburkholderia atlantica]